MSLFRPFCDSCGQRFEEGQLRPLSKYCTYCGQELSPWLRRIIADGVVALTPQLGPRLVTHAADESLDDPDATESENSTELELARRREGGRGSIRRGRGGIPTYSSEDDDERYWHSSRGRVRGRPRMRGSHRGSTVGLVNGEVALGNLGRGHRNSGSRPDYSLKRMWQEALQRTPKTKSESDSPSTKRKCGLIPINPPLEDYIRIETSETSPDLGKSPQVVHGIPDEFQTELDALVPGFRPINRAKRSRPFSHHGLSRTVTLLDDGDFSELEDSILNGDPPNEEPRTYDSAEEEISKNTGDTITLKVFDLGPVIEVPDELCESLSRPRSAKDLHILTARESLHEFLPQRPGFHGILYLNREDIPKYIDRQNFALLKTNDVPAYNSRWYYLGQYRIANTFPMSVTQWKNIPSRVKSQKTRHFLVKGVARRWCLSNGIDVKSGFRAAVDQGKWRFDCLVIQCIGFDRELYEKSRKEEVVEPVKEQEEI